MAKCPKCDTEYGENAQVCESCEQPVGAVKKPKPDYTALAVRAVVGYWPMWIAGALFMLMQWEFPFSDWWRSWNKQHSYYSHGPLVPLISLFMVWANRKRIAAERVQSSWFGLVLLIPSIPLFVFARWTGSGVVCSMTFLAFMIGGLLLFTGWRMTRLLLFPVLYLAFMIPAPATLLDSTTFRIQYTSTTIASHILNAIGYDVKQVGATITGSVLPDTLRVEGPCSGFRMLISLLTFTAFFVYMLRAPLWKKMILVASAFPLSTLVNGIRIASVGCVGIWFNSAKTMYKFHDFGAMVFELVLSFGLLFAFARLIRANDFGLPEPSATAGPPAVPSSKRTVGGGVRGFAVIGVFALVLLTNYMVHPLETTAKGYLSASEFPKSFGNWVSDEVPLDPLSAKELKTAAMIQRLYRYTIDDLPNVFVLVQAAADTDAFHDPHSCIPGGGSSIVDERIIPLKFSKPRPMTAKATMLRSISEIGDEFVLIYWYRTGSETYATTSQVRWKMRVAQIRDMEDLLFRRATNEDVRKRAAKRQTYCYRFSAFVGSDSERDHKALLEFIKEFIENSKDAGER
jgi:exosortase